MPPSPAAPCDRCQRSWILVSPRNLPRLSARSRTVLPSMHRARSLRNQSRAVSLRARLPSKDPQTAARMRNQQVDEQALSSLEVKFQSADDSWTSKRAQDFCNGAATTPVGATPQLRKKLRRLAVNAA